MLNKKAKMYSIGEYPLYSLQQAREITLQVKKQVKGKN